MERAPFYWLNEDSRKFLKSGYLLEGVEPESRYRDIADHAEFNLNNKFKTKNAFVGFADKFYHYLSLGWYSLSSPIISNFGLDRGLPISCFSSEVQDSTSDILNCVAETGMLTKFGGGTASYFGNLRHRGAPIKNNGKSNGAVSFMEIFDVSMNIISQGQTRRGSFAAYLPIDHPDIHEFLQIRNDESTIQNISIGVTIPNGWMQSMIDGDTDKRTIWAEVLQKRSESGFPYIVFQDNVNNHLPQSYVDKGMEIKHSNLCTEILEYTSADKTFTCCLSSMNLELYEEWKHTDAVKVMMQFLDAVLEDFIEKSEDIKFLNKAFLFAKEHRSVGLGVLGWHSYLQSQMIPFEGMAAKFKNAEIFKFINKESLEASKELAIMFGEPKILEGYNERFSTRIAIAPTTSSSFILGQVSPSIEPLNSNYFLKDLAKGKFSYKNPHLAKLLDSKDKNNEDVWLSILSNTGSVRHLDFLTNDEKNVFKTFEEISQLEIVQQAAQRQIYIDQGQSLNIMIHPSVPLKEINALMIEAWSLGIKTLYYQRSSNLAQELNSSFMSCVSCEA
jgi:ribonucleoside-diphosphate reductase alpha chain